jgi:hypothetical protein
MGVAIFINSSVKYNHRGEWEGKFASSDIPKLNDLIDFLERKCQTLELTEAKKPVVEQNHESRSKRKVLHIASNSPALHCKFCKISNHNIRECKRFQNANVDHR